MESTLEKLSKYQSSTPSKWRERAEQRRANRSWLRYSQRIAMLMHDRMEEMHINQSELARLMDCSQQYVSKVLKGKENLSIETICKIENALDIVLLPQMELA